MASTVIGSPRVPPEHGACLACLPRDADFESYFVNLLTISREHDTRPSTSRVTEHVPCLRTMSLTFTYISTAIQAADAQTPITS